MEALKRIRTLDDLDKALLQKDIPKIHYLPTMCGPNTDAMASYLCKFHRERPTVPRVRAVHVGRKLFLPILITAALGSLVICTQVVHIMKHYFL